MFHDKFHWFGKINIRRVFLISCVISVFVAKTLCRDGKFIHLRDKLDIA